MLSVPYSLDVTADTTGLETETEIDISDQIDKWRAKIALTVFKTIANIESKSRNK